MPNNTCEHCGGSQLISGLTVSASGGGGDVRPGLLCKEKEKGFFKPSERGKREGLFADLCTSCGTVKRLYVKDPKRDWASSECQRSVTGAIETQGGAQLTREEKVAVVEAYLKGLVGKDISKVPFATDITFEGPRVPPLAGREVVVGFLKMILPAIKDVQIKQHIVEGDYVATVFDMETADGIDRVFDRIRLLDGDVKEIHSFYYPRQPQTNG